MRNNILLKQRKIVVVLTIFLLICPLLLTGCDPMKNVLISNYTGKDVRIQIIQDSTNQLSLGPKTQAEFELMNTGDSSSTRYIWVWRVFKRRIKLIQLDDKTNQDRDGNRKL